MTAATHSGSIDEPGDVIYAGGASGFVLRAPGLPTIYFAGDTGLFGDMKMIGEIYRPAIAFLPIGDHYTMGPDTAAIAARWLGVQAGRADALGHVSAAHRHAGGAEAASSRERASRCWSSSRGRRRARGSVGSSRFKVH